MPGVTDTENKLKILSSSFGTKIATALINSTILFYSTLFHPILFQPLHSPQFTHRTALFIIRNCKNGERKEKFEAISNFPLDSETQDLRPDVRMFW